MCLKSSGRSGAIGGLGIHDNQQTPIYTSQSEAVPVGQYTAQSTHQQVVSVEVLKWESPRELLTRADTPGEPIIVSNTPTKLQSVSDTLKEPLIVSNTGQARKQDVQLANSDHKAGMEVDKVLHTRTNSEVGPRKCVFLPKLCLVPHPLPYSYFFFDYWKYTFNMRLNSSDL